MGSSSVMGTDSRSLQAVVTTSAVLLMAFFLLPVLFPLPERTISSYLCRTAGFLYDR